MAPGLSSPTQSNASAPSGAASFSGQAGITAAAVGDFWLCVLSWYSTVTGGAQSGIVSAFSDSQANTWTQIGSVQYSTSVHGGAVGTAVFYAFAKNVAATTFAWTITGFSGTAANLQHKFNSWGFSPNNIFTPFVDTTTHNSGSTTAFSTGAFTPGVSNDALVIVGAGNNSNTLAPTTDSTLTMTGLTNGTGSSFNLGQFFQFLGAAASPTVGAPYTFTGTFVGAAADWVIITIGFTSTQYAGLAQGDTFEASGGGFQPFKELFFQGDIFLGNYTGLLWLKNVYMLSRDYWDKPLSTPYSGQLFPVGPGEGGPGQIYPY